MVRRQFYVALLAGGLVAATASSARADCCAPVADCCAPKFRTVCVNEWVPETYQTTRTVCKMESRQETYTAYRCETVPETRTRQVTVYKKVAETRTETRNVCVTVPVVEERTVMQTSWKCVPETKVVRKCVDKGHYECKEVPCGPSCFDKLKRHFHHKGCCDCCEPCCEVRTKTVKCWVPCPTWEEHTVTCMKRVCESHPVTCKVTVCKKEMRQESYQVTCWKCVPEVKTETYTVCTTRQVPYQATRTVCVSVPHQETVTCTRMVCHKVEKQVPCDTCCETTCCKHRLFHKCGGHSHHHSGCCD